VRAELTNHTRSGALLSLELSIVPIFDGNGHCTHFVAIERDIGARLRTERALRLNNERFELMARATTDIIYDRDVAAGRIWWNQNLNAVLGQHPEQLADGLEPWLNRIHADDRERVGNGLGHALAGNGQTWDSEYRFLRGDGRHARVVDRAFIIRDESGEAVRVIGSILDVTELRRLDEQARQSQKLEAVGQLTGGVAHDFNNLLTVILGNAEILSEEIRDPERQAMAQVVTTAAERGAELTGRLLAFARRQALAPRRIDLNRLITDMDGLLRRTLSEEIEIELDLDEDAWPVELDAVQFEVALLNLAVNARDAMPGGGRLTLATANVRLDEQAAELADLEPGPHVRVTVADTGCGIPAAVLDRVFEPFFTTKEVGKGSGLGLSMVYGFVKQSGGHIQIESEAGRGTRVVLWLPRSEAGEPPERAAEQDEDLPRGSEQVLVVEDDPMVRRHLSRQLELLGYRVSTAESGAEALVLIEQHGELDLLLTDVVMPGGMNGRELAERALALRPDLTLLYTSGYPEEAISRDGRLEEGVALLPKPYRRRDLALQVRAVLDARSRT
jgi:PAS domain S-box-containing protein